MNDSYTTIARPARVEVRVQGSRFVAAAFPVTTAPDADRLLGEERGRYHDATHHCYAYRLGPDGGKVRTADDGEPSGTAGRPILAAIERAGVTNVLVVVTRYFGGVKLGTGGLARAYGGAPRAALADAPTKTQYALVRLIAEVPDEWIGHALRAVSRCGGSVVETGYDNGTRLTVDVRLSKADELEASVRDLTSGRVTLRRLPESFTSAVPPDAP